MDLTERITTARLKLEGLDKNLRGNPERAREIVAEFHKEWSRDSASLGSRESASIGTTAASVVQLTLNDDVEGAFKIIATRLRAMRGAEARTPEGAAVAKVLMDTLTPSRPTEDKQPPSAAKVEPPRAAIQSVKSVPDAPPAIDDGRADREKLSAINRAEAVELVGVASLTGLPEAAIRTRFARERQEVQRSALTDALSKPRLSYPGKS